MKNIPFHFLQPRAGSIRTRNDESSIALIITLAVMSLLLVLVLAFASVSKVEIQTATANRDFVASKFLAQAALQRAIADLSRGYYSDPNAITEGLPETNSFVSSNLFSAVTGIYTNFVTDIESVEGPDTANPIVKVRGDNTNDFVALPGGTIRPQWIGIKNINGDLIGRVAYYISGSGLCINAIGNTNAHHLLDGSLNGLTINSRNQGQSPGEINLSAALIALGWNDNQASNDVSRILTYRYGSNRAPGVAKNFDGDPAADDNNNRVRFGSDRIDNNGDGQIDEQDEGIDEPEEVLALSDETNSPSIVRVDDDQLITDLKQLHNGTIATNDIAMQDRFRTNFSAVVQTFTTQSPVLMNPNLINLNNPAYVNNSGAFYNDLIARLRTIGAFYNTNSYVLQTYQTQQVQVACNIVSYRNNADAPFWTNAYGQVFVGVGEVPFLNEIVYEVRATCTRVVNPGPVTNYVIGLTNVTKCEVWYPYTNKFPKSGGNYPLQVNLSCGISNIIPSDFPPLLPVQPISTFSNASWNLLTSLKDITNSAQFGQHSVTNTIRGITNNEQSSWFSLNPDIKMSNFYFGGDLRKNAAGTPEYLDYWRDVLCPKSVSFSISELTNGLSTVPPTNTRTLTNVIAMALNDPRIKPLTTDDLTNYIVCAGRGNEFSNTLGRVNNIKSIEGADHNIFYPQAYGADDYQVTTPIPGIASNTFYISKNTYFSSAAELGRVHRGNPWKTIDFSATINELGQLMFDDGRLLNEFTVWRPLSGNATNYLHGRVNLNTGPQKTAVWAALFAGMPLWDSPTNFVDYDSTIGAYHTDFPKTRALAGIIRSGGPYRDLSQLAALPDLANMNAVTNSFPMQRTDVEREWLVNHMLNLVNTRGNGNFFTIYAWGQSLKGPFGINKTVAAETMIMAMVQAQVVNNRTNLNVVYFRYNPDIGGL